MWLQRIAAVGLCPLPAPASATSVNTSDTQSPTQCVNELWSIHNQILNLSDKPLTIPDFVQGSNSMIAHCLESATGCAFPHSRQGILFLSNYHLPRELQRDGVDRFLDQFAKMFGGHGRERFFAPTLSEEVVFEEDDFRVEGRPPGLTGAVTMPVR